MKAVLVFCEGYHDVVFAQRSLGAHGDCEWVDRPIGGLPSPFGSAGRVAKKGIIAMRSERQAIDNLRLRHAARPPLPCFESIVENTSADTMFFLVRAHGQDQRDPVVSLLQTLDLTITDEPAGTFDVSEYAAAFLFDANGVGVTQTLGAFRLGYGGHFGDLSDVKHGKWVSGTTVPVGCFVFHRSGTDETGTLEDHLAPMAASAWPQRYAGAEGFIDGNRTADDKVSTKQAERLKAIITVSGQFDNPGDPLSNVIGRNGLPQSQFQASPLSAELADFLTGTPWSGA